MDALLELLTRPWVLPHGSGAVELAYPLVLLLAPLPLLLTWRLAPYATRVEALHVAFFDIITRALGSATHAGAVVCRRGVTEAVAGALAWCLLLLAATQPAWVEPPREKIVPARDVLLALDISQSMETRDLPGADGKPGDRLGAALAAIDAFVRRRQGDRLGLVVFANGAHLAVPFTLDHELLRETLAQTRGGMAGPRTMIGDAIGLGIKLFEGSKVPARVMILLTDGADTGSRIPPETAARLAHEHGIVIHAIGLGRPGNTVDRVDVDALQAIAGITGGRFALADRADALLAVYARLDALETQNHARLTHRARRPLFHWPLGLALLLWLGTQVWRAAAAARRERGGLAGAQRA